MSAVFESMFDARCSLFLSLGWMFLQHCYRKSQKTAVEHEASIQKKVGVGQYR